MALCSREKSGGWQKTAQGNSSSMSNPAEFIYSRSTQMHGFGFAGSIIIRSWTRASDASGGNVIQIPALGIEGWQEKNEIWTSRDDRMVSLLWCDLIAYYEYIFTETQSLNKFYIDIQFLNTKFVYLFLPYWRSNCKARGSREW